MTSSAFGELKRITWREKWKDDYAVIYDYSKAKGPVCILHIDTCLTQILSMKREKQKHKRMRVRMENANRSNLKEDERFKALEQYRKALGLKKENYGFLTAMEKATGMPTKTLQVIYDVQDVRNKLKVCSPTNFKQPTFAVIQETMGLPEKQRLKLVTKAVEDGLGARAVRLIHTAVKQMDSEVRNLVLDEKAKLSRKTIEAIGTINDMEKQKETVKAIVQWLTVKL